MTVVDAVRALCDTARDLTADPSARARIDATRARLDEPLRLAIAGRIKAGKSTLLNALVGERLAPTDAGECTRVVSWYRRGLGYGVRAQLLDGGLRDLGFSRDGGLDVDLADLDADGILRLLVDWPSERLARTTLIDTPGLASLDATVSERTLAALGVGHRGAPDADAVVYLMRHLHRVDAEFLEGFRAGAGGGTSPVSSIAVLSRADEVGAGRLDAMDSARRIAATTAADPRVAALSSTVVAVAGLVGEAGATLTEAEFQLVRAVAGLPDDERGDLLLSADRFAGAEPTSLEAAARRALLDRLGLFGVRFAVEQVRAGRAGTTGQLAAALLDVSGLRDLERAVDERLRPRAATLQARSALVALSGVADDLEASDPDAARRLRRGLDEVAAAAHELAELRLAHLVATGMTGLDDDEAATALRLTGGADATDRLGLDPDAGPDERRAAALAAIERWRTRGGHPGNDPVTTEVCDIAARSAEGLYVATA
jgi:hypothetical protein